MTLPTKITISTAAHTLRSGGIVAFPTETVYGLGADALNDHAVRKIFALKGRPATNPLIVHVATFEEISSVSVLSDPRTISRLERLRPFIPGPLSVVLPKGERIPDSVTAGGDTVAVRVPAHPVALDLLRACGFPLAAPSANRSTRVSPTCAEHVYSEFGGEVEVLDGGPTQVGLESTVVSLLDDEPCLLRPGAVTREMLEEALSEPVRTGFGPKNGEIAKSPGLLTTHYAPKTPVVFATSFATPAPGQRAGLVTFSKEKGSGLEFPYAVVRALTSRGDLEEAARGLFATLRELDDAELDVIVVEECSEAGIGAAIMDRLRRATARSLEGDTDGGRSAKD